ncbi:MAG: tripartite tricarboxylate transporter substrate binding protein [Pseudomonadota bacterium]|nr:tripartite tricarboxylate transporter substrate binding protein [Pseudomonadota bacterium]
MKTFIRQALRLCLALAFVPAASAGDYPDRPVRIVIPYAAGGGTDIVARKLAVEVSNLLGQSLIIENRPGASGIIGVTAVTRAKPDGYTLLMTHSAPIIQNPYVFDKLAYDPHKELIPVVGVSRGQQVFVAHPSMPATNLKDFIAYAKSQGDKVAFGSWGQGTVAHYAGDYLNKLAGLRMIHVPYSGSGQTVQAVIGGQVPVAFLDPATARQQVQAEKLRALAVAGDSRSPALPDTPTFKELGMPEMSPFGGWIGILAPAGTRPDVVAKVGDAVAKVVAREDIGVWMNERGFLPLGTKHQAFAAAIKEESERWAGIFRAIGVEKQAQ